jgi:hypothetical protein
MEQLLLKIWGLTLLVVIHLGCSQAAKDKGIKADIASKAREEYAFAGVNYTVKDGTVYLGGNCPSLKDKDKVNVIVKKLAGVKNVEDSIQIVPVVLDQNYWLRRAIDSVIEDYPQVTAQMREDTVVLIGSLSKDQLPKMMEKIKAIPVSGILNNVVLQ